MAIVRYVDQDENGNFDTTKQGTVQVLGDNGFMYLFQKRFSDEMWKSMMCIQTNVKSQIGLGYPIHIDFYAPVDINDPEKQIFYNYRDVGDDLQLIKEDEEKYCLKQVLKMCFYIQKIY